MQILPDIRKHLIYKYISYRLKKLCTKSDSLSQLNQETQETICADVARKTRTAAALFGIIYFMMWAVLNVYMVRYPDANPFTRWYVNYIDSILPLTQSDWGIYPTYRRAPVILISIKLIPVGLIISTPLLLWMTAVAELLLSQKLKDIATRS